MDKMRMESVNMTAQNIERIGALFPNCMELASLKPWAKMAR
ncbi:hypothetical protein J2S20_002081 [Moryella indoligenes]|uniref:Uncharacterized protein n=1 Tax=Moryella indoligenes TaxID=371674 RepID=A0AAE3VBP2_9FIRM|nr:hypothetical protein [Moryella indoligenes]MDQ0153361.1 hypothetical protein [Moryella indoligenes]